MRGKFPSKSLLAIIFPILRKIFFQSFLGVSAILSLMSGFALRSFTGILGGILRGKLRKLSSIGRGIAIIRLRGSFSSFSISSFAVISFLISLIIVASFARFVGSIAILFAVIFVAGISLLVRKVGC